MDQFIEKVNGNAKELLQKYIAEKAHVSFRRPLNDFKQNESQKLAELRSMYQPKLVETKFLRATYFSDHSRFDRYQDIPATYFIKGPSSCYFVSHRWEDSPRQPDPT